MVLWRWTGKEGCGRVKEGKQRRRRDKGKRTHGSGLELGFNIFVVLMKTRAGS